MISRIFFLITIVAVLFGCKKKIPKDALVYKIAGKHVWSGTEIIWEDPPHGIDTVFNISFSTTIYAISSDAIMYMDSINRMDTLYYTGQDTATKNYHFEYFNNSMSYSLLNDSINWGRNFVRNGRKVKWELHSP